MHAVLRAFVCLALAAAASAVRGQEAAAAPDAPGLMTFSERTTVNWVLVPVTVKDKRGRFVTDLERNQFRLIVDGRYRAFETFDAEAASPISLIHLQDLSGSMATDGSLEASREALDCFVDGLRPADELAIATFGSGRIRVEVPFTDDTQAALEAAAIWQAYGSTALHDAVGWLPEIGLEGRHTRRAAVLLTDGADNASTISPAGSRAMVRSARLPVYVVALGSSARPRKSTTANAASDRVLLEALAHESGGRFFAADATLEAARDACGAIGEEIRHQYVLGFRTAGGRVTDHRLGVEVVHGQALVVTHRSSYRGGSMAARQTARKPG